MQPTTRSLAVVLIFTTLVLSPGTARARCQGKPAVPANPAGSPNPAGAPNPAGSLDPGSQTALAVEARAALEGAVAPDASGGGPAFDIHTVTAEGDALSVCLAASIQDLARDEWLGVEELLAAVRKALTDVDWRSLSVQAVDPTTGQCRPLSDFAPQATSASLSDEADEAHGELMQALSDTPSPQAAGDATSYPASLAGKTVYVSAGHGWFWNGSTWRTQRPPYQDIIEDHNNAEAVDQFLIPYLENAGATVIPVRERDWATTAVVADNDGGGAQYIETGTWSTGGSGSGYNGGSYRYAVATPGVATASATWLVSVPAAGSHAVYAWVYPGANRVPDARYTINHAGGATTVTLDQRVFPNTWRYLGTFPFASGGASIRLDNVTAADAAAPVGAVAGAAGGPYAVIADAVRVGGGTFDSLAGLPKLTSATTYVPSNPPTAAPFKPWWETSTFYWAQHMGFDPYDSRWSYYNDVVSRPMFARWHQSHSAADAVYISWHTNGSRGTARGTVSYVHNGDTYPRTDGSTTLQAVVHDELVHDIRAGWDPGWRDRGKGQLNLGEMRMLWDPAYPSARVPGVLLEIAFHDNYEDALALKDPSFNQLSARAVYHGIAKYFDGMDGQMGDVVLAPEPPTHLRVQNLGDGGLRVAWNPSPTDGAGLRGDPATGYHVYTSGDGFAWGAPLVVAGTETTLTGLPAGETRYIKVTGINNGGESFPTQVLGARVGEPALLLVNGFDKFNRFGLVREVDPVEGANLRMFVDLINQGDYIVHHGQAVPSDEAWDSATNEAVAAGYVDLLDYGVVDWILGEETDSVDGTFNSTERTLLSAYLAQDRGLLVTGSEYAWHLEEQGGAPWWLQNELHVDYVADDAGTRTARPTDGAAFAGTGDLHFDTADEYSVDYPDVLASLGGQVAMTYVGGAYSGQGAAVQYSAGCRRVLALGFPLETLRAGERGTVMAQALAYLGACAIETAISQPEEGGAYNGLATTLAGSASGDGVDRVLLQLQRGDGVYWAGSTWAAEATWFEANGIESWTYTSLAWPDETYALQAKAVGSSAEDTTPAQVGFVLDRVSPAVPAPITPTSGITLTSPVVMLSWTDVGDDGSPVGYDVDVDSNVARAQTTPYRVSPSLFPGAHAWRVRGVDAAGNVSAWSLQAAFAVDVHQAFLPVITRE